MSDYTANEGDFTAPGAKNGITDFINNASNTGKEVSQTIASETLGRLAEKAGTTAGHALKGAALLIQPAVWVVGGKMPQPGDISLWAGTSVMGLLSSAVGWAAIPVGIAKAMVEDAEDDEIKTAVAAEPERYRPFIGSVRNHGSGARELVAMTIAAEGGVAWRVGAANWCYVTDSMGRLVCDYRPVRCYESKGPELPLRIASEPGARLKFVWRSRNGNLN